MAQDDSFFEGDQAIKRRLEELATESGLGVETIERIAAPYGSSDHEYFVYGLRGTTKSVTLRASEIRLSADPFKLAERIEPRLKAMFEEMWWQKAVILMNRHV
jgi:hypothetical protein